MGASGSKKEEKKTISGSPEPIELESLEKTVEQMKKCVCRVYGCGEGTGFFVQIPDDSDFMPVLITTNSIIGEDEIANAKEIKILINEEGKKREFEIDKKRKRYTNQKLDIAIIELAKRDGINNYLDLDDSIVEFLKNKKEISSSFGEIYSSESLYALNCPKGKHVFVSYSVPPKINKEEILHKCNVKAGSTGAPLLLSKNQKVIGIHTGYNEENEMNKGLLIIYALSEFLKLNDKEMKIIRDDAFLNEMVIKYDVKEDDEEKIKLFGSRFIENNKNKCKLVIRGKEQEIFEYLTLTNNMRKKGSVEITLKEIKKITNMSYMFGEETFTNGCWSLSPTSNFSKWDTQKVTDMSGMFAGCQKLTAIPKISKWSTENVTDMSYMFSYCNSLESLPDLSNWNTGNVTDMRYMFSDCNKLSSMTNISKWNVENVVDIRYMFSDCKSLKSIPDLSKWNTKNVKDMSGLFYNCNSLTSMTNISKWDTKNVINMNSLFSYCSSLSSIPDLSKWDIQNVTDLSHLFSDCSLLYSLPNLSKFNTINVKNLSYMFYNCKKLSSIAYIYKWNTQNVTDMSGMFSGCDSITSISDISEWNTENVIDMSFMFSGCSKLPKIPDISKWNTDKLSITTDMFLGCKETLNIPEKFKK